MQNRQNQEFPWPHNLQPQELLPPQHNQQPQELLPPWHNEQPQELLPPWHNEQPQELLPPQHNHQPQELLPPWHNDPQELPPPWHNEPPQELLPPQHNHQPQQQLLPPQYNLQPQELLPPQHNRQPQELLPPQHNQQPQDGIWQHHHYDQQYQQPLHNHPAALGLPPPQPQELLQRLQHQEGMWQHHRYDPSQHQQPLDNHPAALGLPTSQPQEMLSNIELQLQETLQGQHQQWPMPHHHFDHQHQRPRLVNPSALGLPPSPNQQPVQVIDGGVLGANSWGRDFARTNEDLRMQIQQPIVGGNLPQVIPGGVLGANSWGRDFARTNEDPNEDLCRRVSIFVDNIPVDFDDRALYKVFTEYHSLESAEVHLNPGSSTSRRYGYVTFGRFEEAQAAIDKYHGKKIGDDTTLECYWAAGHDRTTVFVGNLPPQVTQDDLIRHFNSKSNSGSINRVNFDRSNHAYVRYSAHTDALRAINRVNNTKLFGKYTIKCDWPYSTRRK